MKRLAALSVFFCALALACDWGKLLLSDPIQIVANRPQLPSWGRVVPVPSEKWRTTFYVTANEPLPDGTIPWATKDSKAIVLFFHGSGTMKASGKNFIHVMEGLAQANVASVAIDMPFHKDGPYDPQFDKMDYFMNWLHGIVQEAKKYGKPIYMAGHSFGPMVIQEYIARYPDDIAGATLISPASGFHPALKWTYNNVTVPGFKYLDAENNTIGNDAGGTWAGKIEDQATWMNRPTPKTKVQVILGQTDEWWPGNTAIPAKLGVKNPYSFNEPLKVLKDKYPGGKFDIVPNIGHYIFGATAENGKPLILERLFDIANIDPKTRYPSKPPETTPRQELGTLYQVNPSFRKWIGDRYPHAMRTPETAEGYLRQWRFVEQDAWRVLMKEMKENAPEFFAAREASWTKANTELEKAKKEKRLAVISASHQILQNEYIAYVEAKSKGERPKLGPDMESPNLPPWEGGLIQGKNIVTLKDGFVGSNSRRPFETAITDYLVKNPDKGRIIGREDLGGKLTRITYEINGKRYEKLVVDVAPEELQQWAEAAYRDHLRKTNFTPGDGPWQETYNGVTFRGRVKSLRQIELEVVKPD